MRVLMISSERQLFEDGQVRRRIIEQNKDLEHLTILVFGKQLFDQMIEPNIRVVSTASWYKFFYVLDAIHRLWYWRKDKFDVITSQDPVEMALVAVVAARMFNAALAVQDHGYYFHGNYYRKESFLNFFRYWFARWAVKRADAIRVVSQRTEAALIGLGVGQNKIVRFPLAISSVILSPSVILSEAEESGSAGPDPSTSSDYVQDDMKEINTSLYFFMAARLVPIKRVDIAIHAFSLFAKKHPDVKLLIQGRGPLEERVKQKIKEFGLDGRVELLPWGENLELHYANALATLITSDREGFNMTAIESLTCGTPVIMTDVGCAGEVVIDGENGYVVSVGDVYALADRMERVLQDPHSLREKVEGFKWDKSNVGMMELYKRALVSKPKSYAEADYR
ncbi:MAG: glycosyltransferase [Patescibacteria group bacterium]